MAALTAATAITGGIALAGSALEIGQGISQSKKADKLLENLEVPELDNAFEDIQISTLGSDMMREDDARTTATALDTVKSGGVRSVMGALPGLVNQGHEGAKENRAYVDGMITDRDYATAEDNTRIRRLKENRYLGEVQGLGQMKEVGNQNTWSGVRGAMSSISYMGDNGLFDKKE